MRLSRAACVLALGCLLCTYGSAAELRIDATLPGGGDCAAVGTWDASRTTCVVQQFLIPAGDQLFIASGTLEVLGTLTVEGRLDSHSKIVNRGFLDNQNDVVNFWTSEFVNSGQYFSHFMYNFGALTNEPGGTIEFSFHVENNAPMTNHGYIYVTGSYINIPFQSLNNHGTLDIGSTGTLDNDGLIVNTGQIDNQGSLMNRDRFVEQCGAIFTGNPMQGDPATYAQEMTLQPDRVEWCAIDGGVTYDVVGGPVAALRSSAGDFSTATERCLADDTIELFVTEPGQPAPGQADWYTVRTNEVPSASYDAPFGPQVGSRDPEIAASPDSCP